MSDLYTKFITLLFLDFSIAFDATNFSTNLGVAPKLNAVEYFFIYNVFSEYRDT